MLKVLLLAAGVGNRLRPFTEILPKCLMPIQGRPLLGIWLDMLKKADVERIYINGHYKHEMVLEYLQSTTHWKKIEFIYEHELLGTAGTLNKNIDKFQNSNLLLAHADNLTDFLFSDFANQHFASAPKLDLTMMTFITNRPQFCGIVEMDKGGVMIDFHEKVQNPPGNLASAAIFILKPKVIRDLPRLYSKGQIKEGDFSKEVLPYYKNHTLVWHNSEYHLDIGDPDSFLRAQSEFRFKNIPESHSADILAWRIFCQKHRIEEKFLPLVNKIGFSLNFKVCQ